MYELTPRKQYAATTYTAVLQAAEVQISMAEQGEAWQKGDAERLIRTMLTCLNILIIMMLTVNWGAFWILSMLTSASIPRWVILPRLSLRRNGVLTSHCPTMAN